MKERSYVMKVLSNGGLEDLLSFINKSKEKGKIEDNSVKVIGVSTTLASNNFREVFKGMNNPTIVLLSKQLKGKYSIKGIKGIAFEKLGNKTLFSIVFDEGYFIKTDENGNLNLIYTPINDINEINNYKSFDRTKSFGIVYNSKSLNSVYSPVNKKEEISDYRFPNEIKSFDIAYESKNSINKI